LPPHCGAAEVASSIEQWRANTQSRPPSHPPRFHQPEQPGDLTLPPIINAQGISKAFGANPLFQNVSFTVSEGDRIGLIGPNGSGKSTLLRMLAGEMDADDGEIAFRKRIRASYVEQDSKFKPEDTVRSVVERALKRSALTGTEHDT